MGMCVRCLAVAYDGPFCSKHAAPVKPARTPHRKPCDDCGTPVLLTSKRCRSCAIRLRGKNARQPRSCEMCSSHFVGRSRWCSPQCCSRAQYLRTIERGELTCASCSKPMPRSHTSRPQGEATCRPCQRAAHGLGPDEKLRDHRVRLAAEARSRRPVRQCRGCDAPIDPSSRRWRYCSERCFRKVRNAEGRGTTPKPHSAARGYDYTHRQLRAVLIADAYGTPCVLCSEVMEEGETLHLDHTEDRSGYRGFAHELCNVRDGARRGGAAYRARKLRKAG